MDANEYEKEAIEYGHETQENFEKHRETAEDIYDEGVKNDDFLHDISVEPLDASAHDDE